MPCYEFVVVIAAAKMSHEEILEAADALGEAGCTDGSLSGHPEGMEMAFTRSARSLQSAISSAVSAVEKAGFRTIRVEMERRAIPS